MTINNAILQRSSHSTPSNGSPYHHRVYEIFENDRGKFVCYFTVPQMQLSIRALSVARGDTDDTFTYFRKNRNVGIYL